MSYTPHTWGNDELITAAKLNNLEEGVAAGGGGAVIITDNGTQLDKTYAEIYDLIENGTPCYISETVDKATTDLDDVDAVYRVQLMPILRVMKYFDIYRIVASAGGIDNINESNYVGIPTVYTYQATESTDYPTFYKAARVSLSALQLFINRI